MPPFDPDPQQLRVLEHARGPMRVRGGWGSGKSAALRWRFRRLVTEGDPERVALVLRSRRECDESRRVLQDDLRMALPSLRIVTMQGLARIVLQQRIGADAPEILTADPHFARVAELLAAEDPAAWPAYGRLLPMRGFTDEVRQFLLRAQESLLTPEDIVARAAERHLSGWKELATFYARYLDVLADANETDFAGLVWRAVVEGPQGAPILDHLLVDDMHDVTEGGARLIRDLTTISTVVAGNEAAHVFSFQGTTVEPFRRFAEDLHGVEEVTFTTTWRGADRLARAWKAPHGADEHAAIARELRRIHVAEDVAWRDLAVVARRQGANVAGVVRALEDARIPHHVPEGGIAFTTESATWPYTLALRWIARPDLRDDLVEELLTSRLGGVSPASARPRASTRPSSDVASSAVRPSRRARAAAAGGPARRAGRPGRPPPGRGSPPR
ncbi:MAG: UvrD-helicase domain-containing protein, partial [Actinomycetota bacterium]